MWWIAGPEQAGGVNRRRLIIPEPYRAQVLSQAHGHPWTGHQGRIRTLSRLLTTFFWPSISQDVQRFCRECVQCQTATKRGPPKAPLSPLPIIEHPFERIAMDFVGPLPRTTRGHRFLLVIVDYATRYPDAIPLRGMQVSGVARALVQYFSRVGIPKEILTDQGTSFKSRLLKQLCHMPRKTYRIVGFWTQEQQIILLEIRVSLLN